MAAGLAVIGLGAGSAEQLSPRAREQMRRAEVVLFRTAAHPVWPQLDQLGIRARALDHVYEEEPTLERVYARLAEEVLKEARERSAAYCVPGSPLFAEQSVRLLLAEARRTGLEVELIPGQSSLDLALERLALDPLEGLQVVDAQSLPDELEGSRPLLIFQMDRPALASEVKLALLEWYPDDHAVTVMHALGVAGEESLTPVPLSELDRRPPDHLTTVYVPPLVAEKRKPIFADLVVLMARLRSETGCPWDREQDHRSLRGALLEETHEVLEAIDKDDPEALCQELGDVLLQVLFHAQLGKEEGFFDVGDVIRGLRDKLVERHPHVFGGKSLETAEGVLHEWEGRKRRQRGQSVAEQMADFPKTLPALARAEGVLRRAARAGFVWPDFEHAWRKFEEEAEEFRQAAAAPDPQKEEVAAELGDVLMTLCVLGAMSAVDPEQALRETVDRFIERFRGLEAKAEGRPLKQLSLEELLSLWRQTAR